MNPVVLVILAALLVVLLIALAPFVFVLLVLYGMVELLKYYLPSKKHIKKPKEPKEESKVNGFKIDFLRQ